MPINSASRVPSAVGLLCIVYAYSHDIFALFVKKRRDIKSKTNETIRPNAHQLTIYVHRSVHKRPVEVQHISAMLIVVGEH